MTGYARKFDENITMSFMVNDNERIIIKYGKKWKNYWR